MAKVNPEKGHDYGHDGMTKDKDGFIAARLPTMSWQDFAVIKTDNLTDCMGLLDRALQQSSINPERDRLLMDDINIFKRRIHSGKDFDSSKKHPVTGKSGWKQWQK